MKVIKSVSAYYFWGIKMGHGFYYEIPHSYMWDGHRTAIGMKVGLLKVL